MTQKKASRWGILLALFAVWMITLRFPTLLISDCRPGAPCASAPMRHPAPFAFAGLAFLAYGSWFLACVLVHSKAARALIAFCAFMALSYGFLVALQPLWLNAVVYGGLK